MSKKYFNVTRDGRIESMGISSDKLKYRRYDMYVYIGTCTCTEMVDANIGSVLPKMKGVTTEDTLLKESYILDESNMMTQQKILPPTLPSLNK